LVLKNSQPFSYCTYLKQLKVSLEAASRRSQDAESLGKPRSY